MAALGLSCGIQDLQSSLQHEGCFSWSIWTLSCNMWDPVPWSGFEPRPPALKAWSLSHRTSREVSVLDFECSLYIKDTSFLSNKRFADSPLSSHFLLWENFKILMKFNLSSFPYMENALVSCRRSLFLPWDLNFFFGLFSSMSGLGFRRFLGDPVVVSGSVMSDSLWFHGL